MRSSFTLVELLIVVVIIGILAGFFMPNFGKTLRRVKATDAISNLSLILGANAIYRSKHGFNVAPTGSVTGAGNINTLLGLDVIPNGLTYTCRQNVCTAVYGSDISTRVDLNQGLTAANPSCTSSTSSCP